MKLRMIKKQERPGAVLWYKACLKNIARGKSAWWSFRSRDAFSETEADKLADQNTVRIVDICKFQIGST